MKLIIDNNLTPMEVARLRYQRLYERQMIIRSEIAELKENKPKSLITKFFNFING